jgi:hypothetical protein
MTGSAESGSKTAGEVVRRLEKLLEGRSFATEEELQAFIDAFMEWESRKPVDDFLGLSPSQMHRLLHFPFSSPEILSFDPFPEGASEAPALRLFLLLAEALGETGVKLTAKGNIPPKICDAIALSWWGPEIYARQTRYGGIRTQDDFHEIGIIRILGEEGGLLLKRKGRLSVTAKCRKIRKTHGEAGVFSLLFDIYVRRFNWAYRDRYEPLPFIQESFAFALFLLKRMGEEWRPAEEYQEAYVRAFPALLEEIPESPYRSREKTAGRVFFLRSLERFAFFFGLAEQDPLPDPFDNVTYRIRKTPLLDRLVRFRI